MILFKLSKKTKVNEKPVNCALARALFESGKNMHESNLHEWNQGSLGVYCLANADFRA